MATTVASVIIGYHYVGSSPTYIGSTQCAITAAFIGRLSRVDSLCAAQAAVTAVVIALDTLRLQYHCSSSAHVFIVSDSSEVGRVSHIIRIADSSSSTSLLCNFLRRRFHFVLSGAFIVWNNIVCDMSFTQWM